jgi:hypothetical protein
MVSSLTEFLVAGGYRVRHEVPNMGQSVDVVATRGRFLTFVEAKLRDWRRALHQCRAHKLVADYICIAIASHEVSESLLSEAKQFGYGVIHFDRKNHIYQWVIEPIRNDEVWKAQRRQLNRALRAIEYAS